MVSSWLSHKNLFTIKHYEVHLKLDVFEPYLLRCLRFCMILPVSASLLPHSSQNDLKPESHPHTLLVGTYHMAAALENGLAVPPLSSCHMNQQFLSPQEKLKHTPTQKLTYSFQRSTFHDSPPNGNKLNVHHLRDG